MKTKEMAKISLFIGLFFICSNIIPPINIIGISFTFQTILILLIPFMLNVKEIIIWYVVLILICAIGIPIMSGFSGGLGVLIGPSAGFIYSWLPQMIVQRVFIAYNTNRLSIVLIMIIMSFISIFIGALYFIFVTNGDIIITLKSFLLSFGIVEIIKVFIVMMIVNKLPKRYLT